jgi:hypothetical protein
VLIVLVSLAFVGAATKAAFQSSGNVSDVTFKVGGVDIKILEDLSQAPSESNLKTSKAGLTFQDLFPGWTKDYPIKIYNNGTLLINVISTAYYETANDPASLREYIFAELFPWDDQNSDGVVDSTEIGTSLGKKSIVKWKTEGFVLGDLVPGSTKGLLVRFTAGAIPDTKMGQQAKYTFEFSGGMSAQN